MNNSQSSFGQIAAVTEDRTIRAGRYMVQKTAERRIIADVLQKLAIEPHHRVLDIGCGSGVLLIPLAPMVDEIVGIDHPDVISALAATINLPNITLISGGFPDTELSGSFDRIVAYSVMQCNPDYASSLAFVQAAARMLNENGRLLIADIPNSDRRARFRSSARGKIFEKEWAALRASNPVDAEEANAHVSLSNATMLGELNDAQILDMAGTLRKDGFDVWIVNQSPDLPFGNTREDMIIVRP